MPAALTGGGALSEWKYGTLHRCRYGTLLLYQAPELWGSRFRIISLTWVELWGFEPQTSCMP